MEVHGCIRRACLVEFMMGLRGSVSSLVPSDEPYLIVVTPVKSDVLKGLDPAKMNAAEGPQCLLSTR